MSTDGQMSINLLAFSAWDLIVLLREQMTNNELATAAEIDKGTISKIFNGERSGCSEENWRILAKLTISQADEDQEFFALVSDATRLGVVEAVDLRHPDNEKKADKE